MGAVLGGPTVSVGRYYDPSTDQFLSVDPDLAETGQPYAFTGDNPINGTDPLGDIPGADGYTGGTLQALGATVTAAEAAASGSSGGGGVYADVQTPTAVVTSGGGFQVTVSGDVQFAGPKTKSAAGIESDGTIETQV